MPSENLVVLIGRLGKDVELRYTPAGKAVANFSLATSKKFKNGSGQCQEKTTWHNIVVWGKHAESCNQYIQKGSQVYVKGEIDNRSWDDKDGNKRYKTEIVANQVQFLGGGESSGSDRDSSGSLERDNNRSGVGVIGDEDLPF